MFIVLAPLIGMVLGFTLMASITWLLRKWNPFRLDKLFRRLQLLSAAFYSLGHGGNDAQKTMGIITGLLVASGHLQKFEVPLWVILISHAAIAFGTMFGGWRIVKTMGSKITKLQPFGGFCAETSGALTLVGATLSGIPVSTTHTITGAIVGVGATKRLSAVKWGVAGRIVWAWVLTIPLAAAMSAAQLLRPAPLLLAYGPVAEAQPQLSCRSRRTGAAGPRAGGRAPEKAEPERLGPPERLGVHEADARQVQRGVRQEYQGRDDHLEPPRQSTASRPRPRSPTASQVTIPRRGTPPAARRQFHSGKRPRPGDVHAEHQPHESRRDQAVA